MSNQLFQQIIQGKQIPLTDSELAQFEIFCSAQNLSLDKWISISLTLFEQKKQHCLHFLLHIYKNQLSKSNYRDFVHQDNKVRIYSNIIALLLTKATKQSAKAEADRLATQVEKYLIQCERVKMASNDICRAFSQYYDGNLTKSVNILNKIIQSSEKNKNYDSNQNKFIGMLGLAQIYFSKRNYLKALQQYKKVFTTFKNLPIKARLGMAYCYFYLQKYQMAQACFLRILKLDPNCVQAYIGLAVIQEKNQNFIGYFKNVTAAAKIKKKHPLVLIHLAQHYLIKGDLQRANKFAEQGLVQVQTMTKFLSRSNKQIIEPQPFRNDYLQLKARFNNILGQIQHIKNNFTQALKYYRLASNSGLTFNQIYLTQIYSHPNCQNYVQALQVLQKLYRQTNKNEIRLLNDSLKDLAYFKTKNPTKPGEQHQNRTYQDLYNEAIAYNKHDVEVKIQLSNHIIQTKKARSLKLLLSAYKTLDVQSSSLVKPQLLNNIGVLLLQNHEYCQAASYLTQCVNKLKHISDKLPQLEFNFNNHQNNQGENSTQIDDEQYIKTHANYLIALFNLAIVKEKMCLFQSAIQLYDEIIQKNHYFIDAHIRLAYIYFLKGDIKKSMSVVEDAMKNADDIQVNKFIRIDKIMNIKAAILKLWGDHVSAKDVTRQLMKTSKDLYTQIYQLSIGYETLMKKQPQTNVIKDFLRPNRQIYMRVCHQDPSNAFAYLVLGVLLLVDKRISLKQGNELFMKLKQFSSQDIPLMLYNMGLFLVNYDDYESAIHIFRIYKQKTNDPRGQQMVSLSNFLEGNYDNTIKSVKKSILLNPTNIKNRHQLVYAFQKKCEYQRNQDKNKIKQYLTNHLQILKKCYKFYNFFFKLNINDYVKCQQAPDQKQDTRNNGQKIRSLAEQRKFYVNSNIQYYEKLHRQVEAARLKQQQQKKIKNGYNKIEHNKQNQFNQIQNNVFDQSDSQQIRKRKRQEKKRKALQLAKKKQQEINEKWIDIKQRQKQEKQKKVARNNNRQPRQRGTKKRQKKVKAQSDEDISYQSQKSFLDQPDHSSPSEASYQDKHQGDEVEAPKRKRKQQRREQRRKQRRQKRKKIKKERLSKLSDNDEQFSANPFEDTPQQSAGSKRQDDQSENKSERKKKKKEQKSDQQDDIGIDMNEYLL